MQAEGPPPNDSEDILRAARYAAQYQPPGGEKNAAIGRLGVYKGNHQEYLEGQAGQAYALGTSPEVHGSSVAIADLSEGLGRTSVFHVTHQSQPNFDPTTIGLPSLPNVLGVVARKDAAGNVTSIEAITAAPESHKLGWASPMRLEHYLLEHKGAAVYGAHGGAAAAEPQWVLPGKAVIAERSGIKETTVRDKAGHSTEVRISAEKNEGGQAILFRAPPTPSERKRIGVLSPQDVAEGQKNHAKRRRIKAGIALAATLLSGAVSIPQTEQSPSSKIIANASQAIGHRDTEQVDGVPQAERFFSEDTLNRAREAFQLYMQGNMGALHNLQGQYGYETGWVTARQMEQLQKAQSFGELQQRFDAIFPEGTVQLSVFTKEQPDIHLPRGATGEVLNSSDLAAARQMAQDIASVLETFDKSTVMQKQISFVLGKQLKMDSEDAGGVTYVSPTSGLASIALDITTIDRKNLIGHELTHRDDKVAGGLLSSDISSLNPAGIASVYVGKDWPNTDVKEGKYIVATNLYDRKGSGEDAADKGGAWQGESGEIVLDGTQRGEKLIYHLLRHEKKKPGAIAAFLLRAQPKFAEATASDWIGYALGLPGEIIPKQIPYGGLALALLALLASSVRRKPVLEKSA